MRSGNPIVFMLSAALAACTPSPSADPPIGGSSGAGANGFAGTGGAPSTGGVPGTGGLVGPGSGGVVNPMGTGGAVPPPGGFVTLPGVDPSTPLDRLSGDQMVQACNEFAQYFTSMVPTADLVRGNCVQDAVFNKGATTVAQCQQVSGQCIAAAPPAPAVQCVAPAAGFTCPATIALYEQCANDLTASEKALYALYVCESIDDPNIQQKLTAAAAPAPSCTAFQQSCPGFFPVPIAPDGGP